MALCSLLDFECLLCDDDGVETETSVLQVVCAWMFVCFCASFLNVCMCVFMCVCVLICFCWYFCLCISYFVLCLLVRILAVLVFLQVRVLS